MATDAERIAAAAHRFMTDEGLRPLREWWELQLLNAQVPPGPVDPLRLAMRQGDAERLLAIKVHAAAHKSRVEGGKG
jgi:hypothetical protein